MHIRGEEVEAIAEIDVDLIPQGHDPRKSDPPSCGPFHETCHDSAGLRDQRQVSHLRQTRSEAGVEMDARREHAETIRTNQAEAGRSRVLAGGLSQRVCPVTEP